MLVDDAAGVLLAAGAVVCAAAGVARSRGRVARLVLTLALAVAAAAAFAGLDGLRVAAAGCAAVGLLLLVLERFSTVSRLSWLDAAMGASSVAALAAAVRAQPEVVVAGAGVTGALALSRWRPGPAMLLGAAGVAALGAHAPISVVAAPLLAAAALRREPQADPGPPFSAIVLSAILAFATTALTLLVLGQFLDLHAYAVCLAIASFLVGVARAVLTVTERLRESQELALTDDLTGLGNRRLLLERLEQAVQAARADGAEVALLLVDLDGFKELNDTLGHPAGDEVLRQIGPRLTTVVRDHDVLARLGGDEFAVVLSPSDEAAASIAGLRLRRALERSFAVEGMSVHVDASVGIALFPEHAEGALGLLRRADVAMYEAKRRRTGHEVYRSTRDRHSRERLSLVGELRGAIAAGQLILHYQPKAALASGDVAGVEALVRWRHPRLGLIGPGHFLPLVEHSGLSRALTHFVLDRALEEMAALRQDGLPLTVAVNLGPADLLDLELPLEVERLLERRAADPGNVALEVSEDLVMADPDRTGDVLTRVRAVGVGIALDDFGAGRSSLGLLKQLRVDELKIDRSFVMRLRGEGDDAAIVRSTVDLGRRLGLRVVAEGVASVRAWELLAAWSCDEAQGELVAPPMPARELAAWLRERRGSAWTPVRPRGERVE